MIANTRPTFCVGSALVASCCQTDQAAEAKAKPSWHDFIQDLCTYMTLRLVKCLCRCLIRRRGLNIISADRTAPAGVSRVHSSSSN